MDFVGRRRELDELAAHLRAVTSSGDGRFLTVRGPRQVGKSTLIQRFVDESATPSVFFAAARGSEPASERRELVRLLAASSLPGASLWDGVTFDGWAALLRQLGASITTPTIVVIDELPWLLEGDPALEGELQRVWDTVLRRCPVLLVAVGSDLSVMEAIATHDRPLFGRALEMLVDPLGPAEAGELIGLTDPVEVLEAHLVAGGYPGVLASWPRGWTWEPAVGAMLASPTSPLVVVGERILTGAFPADLQARDVLDAMARGATTFTRLGERTGLNASSLARSLKVLEEDLRLVRMRRPLSATRSRRLTRYEVADPYLRFWLAHIGPNREMILRGRGTHLATHHLARRWPAWAGQAIEPVVRGLLEATLPRPDLADALHVGSWWDRTHTVEVDLVCADLAQAPAQPVALGSIKWRDRRRFDASDAEALAAARGAVPGAARAALIGVSRAGFEEGLGLDLALTPAALVRPASTAAAD